MWLYTDLLQALKGELLSSVFSSDGTFLHPQLPTAGKIVKHFGPFVWEMALPKRFPYYYL